MGNVKLLEETVVSRPPGAAVPTTVALTHFDAFWLNISTQQRLLFYAVNELSTSHFTSSIVPALTSSLSITLQHYFPLSGRLIVSWPNSQQLPYIRCADGDSVSVAICQTTMDFNHLAGDDARSLEQVQALVPKFPPPQKHDETPLLAVQITVFPKSGFSIGLTYSHVAADGRAIVHFMKSWASICGDPNCMMREEFVPVVSRDLISDPDNKLATINVEFAFSSGTPPPPDLRNMIPREIFRYTSVIGSLKINEMKSLVIRKWMQTDGRDPASQRPLRVSTFMVTCALVWVCLLEAQTKDDVKDDQMVVDVCEYFLLLADLRQRLNLPGNYFGNCLRNFNAAVKRSELVGDEGVYEAAKAIGRAIEKMQEEGMKGAEGWRKRGGEIYASGHGITIAGSPKFGVYEIDFGWGRPKKSEHAHIGSSNSFAIADSRSEVGAVEIGLALTALEFQRFNRAFHLRCGII